MENPKEDPNGNDNPGTSSDAARTTAAAGEVPAHGPNKAPRHVPSTSKESPVIARRKITRPPRLESVSESEMSSNVESPCSSSEFGVRSYLHNFYEPERSAKNSQQFFVNGEHSHSAKKRSNRGSNAYRERRWRQRCSCAALWWKAGVFVGANILILAVLALLIGYFVQPKDEIVDYRSNVAVVNQDNAAFNRKLASAKLAGLIMLCAGGFVIAVSLLVPSVIVPSYGDGRNLDEVHIDPDGHFPPYMPLKNDDEAMMEDGIPYTSELTSVQPVRAGTESVVAGKGMVKVQGS